MTTAPISTKMIAILIIVLLYACYVIIVQYDLLSVDQTDILNMDNRDFMSTSLKLSNYAKKLNISLNANHTNAADIDAYFEIFYFNKDTAHDDADHMHTVSTQETQRAYSQWWNYDKHGMIPFTECEEKYLGYQWNNPGRPGDLSFSKPDSFKTLCTNNELKTDLRHAHIWCYDTKFNGKNSFICSLNNVYAYIDDNNRLQFKAFCRSGDYSAESRSIWNGIQQVYGKSPNKKYPLYIDIVSETPETNNVFENASYDDMSNVWFYDNDFQCESHKENDAEHIGNPWHCFGHIEYWYRIAHFYNLSIDRYNMTLVMSQFTDYKFGPNVPIYHFYSALFSNVITSDHITDVVQRKGDANKNKLYYVRQLWIDERSAKGWGAAAVWQDPPEQTFFKDPSCENTKQLRRSHVYHDMKRDLMNYLSTHREYAEYEWAQEIQNISGKNAWEIDGDLQKFATARWNGNANDDMKLIVFGSRWVNGRCRYRCISNMKEIKDSVVKLLDMEKHVVLFGNPGTLSFHAQYHLFKNTRVFVGVHGAVFFMAVTFMEPHAFKFEITMQVGGKETNSDRVIGLFAMDANLSYARYLCKTCDPQQGVEPKPANVDELVHVLTQSWTA